MQANMYSFHHFRDKNAKPGHPVPILLCTTVLPCTTTVNLIRTRIFLNPPSFHRLIPGLPYACGRGQKLSLSCARERVSMECFRNEFSIRFSFCFRSLLCSYYEGKYTQLIYPTRKLAPARPGRSSVLPEFIS